VYLPVEKDASEVHGITQTLGTATSPIAVDAVIPPSTEQEAVPVQVYNNQMSEKEQKDS
jgi:hypothetical protein